MKENISKLIMDALSELNEQLDQEEKLVYDKNLRLTGRDAAMDSMNFVTFVVILQELISDELGKSVQILSDRAFSAKHSPFYSVETLEDFLMELINEA